METTKAAFTITLANIASAAQRLELLPLGITLEYVHNGTGLAPYVFAKDEYGDTMRGDFLRQTVGDILPEFTYKYTRRESMAALEACERALSHMARLQAARQD